MALRGLCPPRWPVAWLAPLSAEVIITSVVPPITCRAGWLAGFQGFRTTLRQATHHSAEKGVRPHSCSKTGAADRLASSTSDEGCVAPEEFVAYWLADVRNR